MLSDIEIAQRATLRPIAEIAQALGIPEDALEAYGRFKAKVSLDYLAGLASRPNGRLILVTAMSPTPAGEGKTTTTVGLADALNHSPAFIHGGCDKADLNRENLPALAQGIDNLERHIDNVRDRYGLPCVVAVNHFTHDTEAEFALLSARIAERGVTAVSAKHWAEGGAGAEFLVCVCGDLLTMPGLPKNPAAQRIDIDAAGRIVGLF